jgi:alkylation response protein AidB-like acyl-CoA dehydrogenase
MESWLNEEQTLLKESALRFVDKEYGFDQRRARVDSEEGFSRDTWARFAEFGWLAAAIPEADGGLGGDAVHLAVLMEAFGRGLVVEPYLASVVLGGGLLVAAGNADQKAALLPALAEGKLMLAFAHGEPRARFNLAHVETRAEAKGDGFRLSGRKSVVFHAAGADKIIVSARNAGNARDREGISLFLLDRGAEGLHLRAYPTVDGQRAADLALDNVRVPEAALLGEPGAALPLIERVVDEAIIAVSAEAVGAMETLVAMTGDYLKTRVQFGVPIASFQVLQHRVVEMFAAAELTKALTYRRPTRSPAPRPPPPPRRRSARPASSSANRRCSCTAAWA